MGKRPCLSRLSLTPVTLPKQANVRYFTVHQVLRGLCVKSASVYTHPPTLHLLEIRTSTLLCGSWACSEFAESRTCRHAALFSSSPEQAQNGKARRRVRHSSCPSPLLVFVLALPDPSFHPKEGDFSQKLVHKVGH